MAARKYRTIVADPPWEYDAHPSASKVVTRRPLPYPTMSVDEIAALPVREFAQNDVAGNRPDKSIPRDGSVLFLWTTNRYLDAGFNVLRRWGFAHSVTLVWCKPPGGLIGGTFYSNVEFVLVGRRGSPRPFKSGSPTRWFQWSRGEHSAKPEAFLDLVETVSPGPYLELFARRQRLGWDTWGDEALNHVEVAP